MMMMWLYDNDDDNVDEDDDDTRNDMNEIALGMGFRDIDVIKGWNLGLRP
jgi:hypothetical protein